MKVPIVKRHIVEGLSPEKELGLIRNANIQRKNAEKLKKSEMKRSPKKKLVKVKIKKNKEEGLE